MFKYINLKQSLVEDLEWAKANEWEVPLGLIINFIDGVLLKGLIINSLTPKSIIIKEA